MSRLFCVLMILVILSSMLGTVVFADEAPQSAAPTTNGEPQGVVIDASIVFSIFAFAAFGGVAAGYWWARKR